MKNKIVLGILGFITTTSIGLCALLLFCVTPVQLFLETFPIQMNEKLPTHVGYYVKANPSVLEKCQLFIGDVDTSVIGIYPAYVTYEDKRFDFQIMVEDKKQPIVKLKNAQAVWNAYIGQTFIAADLVDVQDDTSTTVYFEEKNGTEIGDRITLKKEGNIEYYIVAKDTSGNVSRKQRIRFEVEIDTKKPNLSGVDDVTIKVGETIDLLANVKALDELDGDLTSLIIVSPKSIDTSKPGQYLVTYEVTDLSGNKETKRRVITVTESGNEGQYDVEGGRFLTKEEVVNRDAIVQSLLDSDLDDFNDRSFVQSLNRYLINNYHPVSARDYDSSYDVIIQNRGTRMALVRAVKVLLDARGIENITVYGKNDNMVWNMVKIDNVYRHLDVYANYQNGENHCFLLKTSELSEEYVYDTASYPNAN